ncbi:hypothetical protein D1BOALGB6SA_5592 [Olavius sp. associated proteobacterium Delta 1]|nr:hypothetical protein D1BOALGB6SA_5592 [Olavius sp. associated proteobacterium Delta 1]
MIIRVIYRTMILLSRFCSTSMKMQKSAEKRLFYNLRQPGSNIGY